MKMSNKKEDKSQEAAERIKAATLTAAKGLSRAQAERAARNVNAYGQKEEGPSRWQERKDAKRQMYLMSTEKAVILGERKDLKTSMSSIGGSTSQCQKCYQPGHWTYECKNERVYILRPLRTQQLKNPKLKMKVSVSNELDNPDMPKEERGEKGGKKSKRKHRSDSDSRSDSEASVFETDSGSSAITGSDYSSGGISSSSCSPSSDSEEEQRRRRKKKQKKRRHRHKKYSSSSDSSDSDSASDSDSDDDKGSREKGKRHGKRR